MGVGDPSPSPSACRPSLTSAAAEFHRRAPTPSQRDCPPHNATPAQHRWRSCIDLHTTFFLTFLIPSHFQPRCTCSSGSYCTAVNPSDQMLVLSNACRPSQSTRSKGRHSKNGTDPNPPRKIRARKKLARTRASAGCASRDEIRVSECAEEDARRRVIVLWTQICLSSPLVPFFNYHEPLPKSRQRLGAEAEADGGARG